MAQLETSPRVLPALESVQLRRPYALVGFGGWIDAGFAATGAVRYVIDQLDAQRIAEFDPEPFYSFTDTRPRVRGDGPMRVPEWPKAEWYGATTPGDVEHDLILFIAPEPNLRWRTFTASMLDFLEQLNTELIVSLGAVLAPVHHRARVAMRGRATAEPWRGRLRSRGYTSGRYEGPTGITTVLLAAAQERGLPGFSLSASSPNYLAAVPNPRASAALLRAFSELCDIPLPLAELDRQARTLDEQVEQSLAGETELREAVNRLADAADLADDPPEPEAEEESRPSELPNSAAVLRELEDFLKDLRQNDGDNGESKN